MEILKALIVALYLCIITGMVVDLAEEIRNKRKKNAIFDVCLITGLIIVGILQFM